MQLHIIYTLILIIINTITFLLLYFTYQRIFYWRDLEIRRAITNKKQETSCGSFSREMQSIPWNDFENSLNLNNTDRLENYSSSLLDKLLPFLLKPPQVARNASCSVPQLQFPPKLVCRHKRAGRKVGILLQFGFDVDILEIHLHELDAVVDKFFFVESIKPHNSFWKTKPLVWDKIRGDARFQEFLPKIIHFIIDDATLAGENANSTRTTNVIRMWFREKLQEFQRWNKFLEWNTATRYFKGEDIIGFGDVDEIPHRDNVFFLKHCELQQDPIDIGIWFPVGNVSTTFQSDFPVRNHPYTLGDPTFWMLSTALRYATAGGRYPTRNRGSSPSFLLGGMHMSTYAYPPFRMMKRLLATEAGVEGILGVIKSGRLFAEGKFEEADVELDDGIRSIRDRVKGVQDFGKEESEEVSEIVKMPWFYGCNRERYPAFERRHDGRLN